MIHSFRSLLLLLLIIAPARAQDQRLSPDYTTRELPAELRIQAVAATGSTALALWGVNRPYRNDSAIGNLQMQRMRDSVPVGSPVQVHSDEARPSHFCSVVPFPGKFLLLWNDRRASNPGIYMRWVDTTGAFLTEEEIFSSTKIQVAAYFMAFRTPEATLLLWQDITGGKPTLWLRRLTPDGEFIEAERSLGSANYFSLWAPGGHNDMIMVRSDGNVRLLRSDGTFDSRPIPSTRFERTVLIEEDSTASLLRDSTLEVYRTIFDTIPLKSIALPSGTHFTSAVLSVDTGGNYRIHYGAIFNEWWGGGLRVRRVVASRDGIVGQPETVDSLPFSVYDWYKTRSSFDAGTRFSTCDGGTTLFFNGTLTYLGHYGNVTGQSVLAWAYRISVDGEYFRELPTVSVSTPLCFDDEWLQPTIERTRYKDTSVVKVTVNGISVLLRDSIAPRPYADGQASPNLVLRDGRFNVSWITKPFDGVRLHNTATEMVAAEWEPATGEPAFNYSSIYPQASVSGVSFSLYYHALPGATIVADQVVSDRGYPDYETISSATIYMMVDGWKKVGAPGQQRYSINWTAYPFDPNSSAVAGLSWRSEPFVLWDKEGNRVRSMPYVTTWDAIIPIDSSRQLVVLSDWSAYIDSLGRKKRTFTIPATTNSSIQYRRLLGSRYLRFSRSTSGWQLEIFSIHGPAGTATKDSALYSRLITPNPTARTPHVLQNPNDSSIMILWGSDQGVRLTRLDQYLRVAIADSAISATRDSVRTPTGVFRNDTLFAIWEDFRNLGSDIYATAWRAARIVSSPPTNQLDTAIAPLRAPPTRVAITAITPNPADRIATFFVELTEPGDAVAEILDMSGQVLVRREKFFDMDSGRWDIDVRDLTSGLYMLAVRGGGGVAMTKLVVMRE